VRGGGSSLAAAAAAAAASVSPSAARAARSVPESLQVAGESYGSARVLDLRDQAYSDLNVLHAKFPARNASVSRMSSTEQQQQQQ
jgi:hypothetical protein